MTAKIITKKVVFVVLIGILSSIFSYAQSKQELINLLKVEKDPAQRCSYFNLLTDYYIMDGKSDDSCYLMCQERLKYSFLTKRADLILLTLLQSGDKWSYYSGINYNERTKHAEYFYSFLLEEAKENHNSIYECKAYACLANMVINRPKNKYYPICAELADSVAVALENDSLRVLSNLAIAQCKLASNDIIPAFRNINKAFDYADNIADSSYKRRCYVLYASLYYKLRMEKEALRNISDAFKIDSSKKYFNRSALIEDYGLKSAIHEQFLSMGHELARIDFREWLDFCQRAKAYPTWISTIKMYIFDSYLKEKLFDDAVSYLKQNPEIDILIKDYKQGYKLVWATVRYDMAEGGDIKNTELGIRVVIDSLKGRDEKLLTQARFDLNTILIKENKYHDALKNLDTIIAETTDMNTYQHVATNYSELSQIFYNEKNYELAYNAQKRSIDLKDSVNKFKRANYFNVLQIAEEKHHVEKKQKKDEERKYEAKRLIFFASIIIIITLLGLCAWLVALKMPVNIIRLGVIVSFIFTFEFIKNILHGPIESFFGDNPIILFAIDIIIAAVIGALHHWIETLAMAKLGVIDPSIVNESPR